MSLKGYILDSNGLISLKVSVAMGKWMISVKNSKNSLIFANFGCFCMFRVKKNNVSVVRNGSKRPIFRVPPLWFTAKMTSNFA
jgi:hypothetical protein